jgi:hypothetical protein
MYGFEFARINTAMAHSRRFQPAPNVVCARLRSAHQMAIDKFSTGSPRIMMQANLRG